MRSWLPRGNVTQAYRDAAKGRFEQLIGDNGWENPLDSFDQRHCSECRRQANRSRCRVGQDSCLRRPSRAQAGFSLKLEKSLASMNSTNPMPYSLVLTREITIGCSRVIWLAHIMALCKIDEDSAPILYADEKSGPVWRVAFDPEGKFVASASNNSVVQIWTSPDSDSAVQLRGHLSSVFAVDMSPENRNVASGLFDGTIRLWAGNSPLSPTLLSNSTVMPEASEFSVKNSQISVTASGGQKYWGTLPQEFGEACAAAVTRTVRELQSYRDPADRCCW